jgi:hypothetical protein
MLHRICPRLVDNGISEDLEGKGLVRTPVALPANSSHGSSEHPFTDASQCVHVTRIYFRQRLPGSCKEVCGSSEIKLVEDAAGSVAQQRLQTGVSIHSLLFAETIEIRPSNQIVCRQPPRLEPSPAMLFVPTAVNQPLHETAVKLAWPNDGKQLGRMNI